MIALNSTFYSPFLRSDKDSSVLALMSKKKVIFVTFSSGVSIAGIVLFITLYHNAALIEKAFTIRKAACDCKDLLSRDNFLSVEL